MISFAGKASLFLDNLGTRLEFAELALFVAPVLYQLRVSLGLLLNEIEVEDLRTNDGSVSLLVNIFLLLPVLDLSL